MKRLKVAAAGNSEKNINRIDGRFQAEALRFIRGFDVGTMHSGFYSNADPTGEVRDDNPNFNWKIEGKTVDDITVGPGMATAYGYDILNEETVHLKADRSNPYRNLYIYIEWDFSNPDEAVGKIDIHYAPDAPGGMTWRRSDNLCINPNGIYQMILAKVGFEEDGTISSIRNWGFDGTSEQWQPLYAINSGHAVHSEYAQYAEGKSDKTISQYLDEIYQRLKDLGYKSDKVTLPSGEAVLNEIRRQGNYVILSLDIHYEIPSSGWADTVGIPGETTVDEEIKSMRNTSWTFTIPEFFRPKEEISFQTGAIGTYTYENYKNNEWNYAADGQITTDGKLILKIRYYPGSSGMNYDYRLTNIKLRLGWEANPI